MLHKVKELLTVKEYQKAYVYLRKNKLDMNLLVDIYPEQVVEDVRNGSLLKLLNKVDDINIVLTSLQDVLSED